MGLSAEATVSGYLQPDCADCTGWSCGPACSEITGAGPQQPSLRGPAHCAIHHSSCKQHTHPVRIRWRLCPSDGHAAGCCFFSLSHFLPHWIARMRVRFNQSSGLRWCTPSPWARDSSVGWWPPCMVTAPLPSTMQTSSLGGPRQKISSRFCSDCAFLCMSSCAWHAASKLKQAMSSECWGLTGQEEGGAAAARRLRGRCRHCWRRRGSGSAARFADCLPRPGAGRPSGQCRRCVRLSPTPTA